MTALTARVSVVQRLSVCVHTTTLIESKDGLLLRVSM